MAFLSYLPGHQTFEWSDLPVVGTLVLLEGLLSVDNAMVLGLIARRLPRELRRRALTYGLAGALVLRTVAIFAAAWLLRAWWVKLVGGGYLIYLGASYVWRGRSAGPAGDVLASGGPPGAPAPLWRTVIVIELTDMVFAVDSVLAAVALVGGRTNRFGVEAKYWVILVGVLIGMVIVRASALGFIKLLRKFPRLETAAYLLVLVIGGKLLVEFACAIGAAPDALDFRDFGRPAAWVFWGLMAAAFASGFLPGKARRAVGDGADLP